MKKRNILLNCILSGMVLFSCSNETKQEVKSEETSNATEEKPIESTSSFKNVDPAVASKIDQLFQSYFQVKNALVASKMEDAKTGAKALLENMTTIDTAKLTPEQKKEWISDADIIKENAKHIEEATEISHQRPHLDLLTKGMYSLAKTFGRGKPVFYEFCPMANNSNGGYWLSEEEEIKNPYFGDEMLNCGEVKESIK